MLNESTFWRKHRSMKTENHDWICQWERNLSEVEEEEAQ